MAAERAVPEVSPLVLQFFVRVVRRYLRRHFRAVMGQQVERLQQVPGPMVVYLNHSSWWDPMVGVLLAWTLLPERKHYAPMDAAALKRYPILRRIGVFSVEMNSMRGGLEFLRTSEAILRSGGVLWMTPQGRFADAREEELAFKPGLAALAKHVPEATIVPMAVEYTFWDERLPEALVRVGEAAIGASFETALATTMAELKLASCARDAKAFRLLLTGSRGTGGVYAAWRRVSSFFRGKSPAIDHTERG